MRLEIFYSFLQYFALIAALANSVYQACARYCKQNKKTSKSTHKEEVTKKIREIGGVTFHLFCILVLGERTADGAGCQQLML